MQVFLWQFKALCPVLQVLLAIHHLLILFFTASPEVKWFLSSNQFLMSELAFEDPRFVCLSGCPLCCVILSNRCAIFQSLRLLKRAPVTLPIHPCLASLRSSCGQTPVASSLPAPSWYRQWYSLLTREYLLHLRVSYADRWPKEFANKVVLATLRVLLSIHPASLLLF
jgi:hypothetical protein